ncbi:MAG: MFS transporter [Cyanobacteria bacterium P01_H01_bin.58]
MRKFTILWLSHLISNIGTRMAGFAFTLWVWDLTGSATALALTGVFYQLPRIGISLFAGILVDRVSRKSLMILSEAVAATSTLVLLGLYLTGHMAIWQLYTAALIKGGFEKFGQLAYQASITLLVRPQNYTRANSMNSATHYGANISAPTITGILYPMIGLGGLLSINLAAFAIAIVTIALLQIPQPPPDNSPQQKASSRITAVWQEVTFGLRYLWQSPSLRALLIIIMMFEIAHSISNTVYSPMILARTNGDSQALGATATFAGFGGVTSALVLSFWGGLRRNERGMLAGFIGAGLAKTVFGLGRSLSVWLPAQFCSSLNFPLMGSSETALWMAATPAKFQGRVFAAHWLIYDLVIMPVRLAAGVMSDRIFEPAMRSPGLLQSLFAPIFGSGPGAGIALLYVCSAIAMLLVGIIGFRMPQLRLIEKTAKVEL